MMKNTRNMIDKSSPQFANKMNKKFNMGLSSNSKIALNIFFIFIIIICLIYLYNSILLANDAGVFIDDRVDRMPKRQHNYFLRSHRVATWMPPWVGSFGSKVRIPGGFPVGNGSPRCPIGCVFSGRRADRDQNGFSCPNGPMCNSPGCCKYDRDCSSC